MKFQASKYGPMDPNVIKLKSGQSITGILKGDEVTYKKSFNPGDKPGFRFKVNLVCKVDGVLKAQILESGWKVFQQLKELNEAGWDLDKTFVRISRQGTGINDTVWTVSASPTKPTDSELAAANAVKLLTLTVPVDQFPEPGIDSNQQTDEPDAFNNRF